MNKGKNSKSVPKERGKKIKEKEDIVKQEELSKESIATQKKSGSLTGGKKNTQFTAKESPSSEKHLIRNENKRKNDNRERSRDQEEEELKKDSKTQEAESEAKSMPKLKLMPKQKSPEKDTNDKWERSREQEEEEEESIKENTKTPKKEVEPESESKLKPKPYLGYEEEKNLKLFGINAKKRMNVTRKRGRQQEEEECIKRETKTQKEEKAESEFKSKVELKLMPKLSEKETRIKIDSSEELPEEGIEREHKSSSLKKKTQDQYYSNPDKVVKTIEEKKEDQNSEILGKKKPRTEWDVLPTLREEYYNDIVLRNITLNYFLTEINAKNNPPSTEVLWCLIQLVAKSFFRLTPKFWEIIQSKYRIFTSYTPDTLRRYWAQLSTLEVVQIVELINQEKKTLDKRNIKLCSLVNTISEFLKGEIKDEEVDEEVDDEVDEEVEEGEAYTKNVQVIHDPNVKKLSPDKDSNTYEYLQELHNNEKKLRSIPKDEELLYPNLLTELDEIVEEFPNYSRIKINKAFDANSMNKELTSQRIGNPPLRARRGSAFSARIRRRRRRRIQSQIFRTKKGK